MKIDLNNYIKLISSFLHNSITVNDFESKYLKMFKNELGEMTDEEYKLLNNLFLDIDAFCDDPELCDEHDVDEKGLKESCKKTLIKLNEKNHIR